MTEPVCVKVYFNRQQAENAKSLLEINGIVCTITGGEESPYKFSSLVHIQIFVDKKDYDRAKELLES